jgi:hypothetical protein
MSMPEIITRAEAKARGLKRYFTGKPCKSGHFSHRTAPDGQCLECRKISEAEYKARRSKNRRMLTFGERKCKICASPFLPKSKLNTTCSLLCSRENWRRLRREWIAARPEYDRERSSKGPQTAEQRQRKRKTAEILRHKQRCALRALQEIGIEI